MKETFHPYKEDEGNHVDLAFSKKHFPIHKRRCGKSCCVDWAHICCSVLILVPPILKTPNPSLKKGREKGSMWGSEACSAPQIEVLEYQNSWALPQLSEHRKRVVWSRDRFQNFHLMASVVLVVSSKYQRGQNYYTKNSAHK